jgi:hypothetical protein
LPRCDIDTIAFREIGAHRQMSDITDDIDDDLSDEHAATISALMQALTTQQRAFVTAYISNDMANATAAYRSAYPASLKWSGQDASREAKRLVDHPKISPILAIARVSAAAAAVETARQYDVSKASIVRELASMAMAPVTADSVIRPADKRGALVDLARILGHIEDRKSVRLIKGVADLTDEELAALAETGRETSDGDTRH